VAPLYYANDRCGSPADLMANTSVMSGLGGKAAVMRRPLFLLCLRLLGQFKRVIDFDTQISNGAIQFGMSE